MKPTKLKTSKEMDLNSIFIDYVSKNYGQHSITEKLKYYFSELNQNRNVLSHSKDEFNSIKDLTTTLNITTKYFNQIIAIKSKMVFDSKPQSCQIQFSWTDTITGETFVSYNIDFEYYNILFNIASLYFYLGYQKISSTKVDKNLRKEAIKDYKYSLNLFNIIKDEAYKKIDRLELPYDLYPAYCEYCATICVIYGQIEIVKIAEETNPNEYVLRGKLLMGISDSYNKAFLLSNGEPAKRGGKDTFRNYLSNRSFYYKSLVYKKLSETSLSKFDKTGLGYGEALVYQQLSVQQLIECQKTINLCDKLVDIELFNNLLNNEKKIETKLADFNNRLYHQFTPDPKTIKLESKIFMAPLPLDNLYIGENKLKIRDDKTIYCPDLDLLISKEIKPLLDRYKSQMNSFIKQYINKYENESTIKNFIDKLNLPKKIIAKPIDINSPESSAMPSGLWNKISQIQQIGGNFYLSSSMKKILNKSEELLENLNSLLNDIKYEENEDNYYRKKLGDKYVINPSNTLNKNYIETTKNYIAKIQQTREYDIKEEQQLNNNINYYDDLNLTKKQIEQKLAQFSQVSAILTPEEKKIKDEIVKLYVLSDKLSNIINTILHEVNSGSAAIPFLSEVLVNRMTERSVFEITKEKYMKQLEPLDTINNEIKNQIDVIKQIVPNISENLLFPKGDDQEMQKFLQNLDQIANNFNDKIQKIRGVENYYIDLENKVNVLKTTIKDWINQRKDEKKMLIGTFKGHITVYNPNVAENPFDNDDNESPNYYHNNRKDYYSPNSNINQNYNNNNPNPNQTNAYYYGNNNNNNNNQNNNYYNNQNQGINNQNNQYYSGYPNNGNMNNNNMTPHGPIQNDHFNPNIGNNNNYKSNFTVPPGFEAPNNFGYNFNQNQPQNMTNYNPHIQNPFNQNNFKYQK